jgi:sigma-E factor negative regulatory protein RseC
MRSTGVIISAHVDKVTVRMKKGTDCQGCRACDAFGSQQLLELEARNDIRAKIGERVDVEIQPAKILGSSFLVFVFPLLMMIAGYFIGMQLGGSGEIPGILSSFGALVLSFFIVRQLDRMWQQRHACSARVVGYAPGIDKNSA